METSKDGSLAAFTEVCLWWLCWKARSFKSPVMHACSHQFLAIGLRVAYNTNSTASAPSFIKEHKTGYKGHLCYPKDWLCLFGKASQPEPRVLPRGSCFIFSLGQTIKCWRYLVGSIPTASWAFWRTFFSAPPVATLEWYLYTIRCGDSIQDKFPLWAHQLLGLHPISLRRSGISESWLVSKHVPLVGDETLSNW